MEGFKLNHNKKSDLGKGITIGITISVIIGALYFTIGSGRVILKITKILNMADEYYLNTYNKDDVEKYIYAGVVGALGDKYGEYIDSEYSKDYNDSLKGYVNGAIGILITSDNSQNKGYLIDSVYENYPADKAGIKAGDRIVKIDNIDITSLEFSEIGKRTRGKKGTFVKITLYREKENLEYDVNIERVVIEIESVNHTLLKDNIGYIGITSFDEITTDKFIKAYEDLEKQGMNKLIIDLRDNGGGLLDTTVDIADYLMPEGLIVYTEDKNKKRVNYKSDNKSQKDIPIVILVNKDTASASEVLAGALKDTGMAELVGEITFGKGIVQSHFTLVDGSIIKFTTSEYFTPNGNNIHDIGIEPDYFVLYEEIETEEGIIKLQKEIDPEKDNQLKKAVEVIKEK